MRASSTTTPGEWNPTDYAYHLTRRARGLPLRFSLSVYGVDAYAEAIETAIGLARLAPHDPAPASVLFERAVLTSHVFDYVF